MLYVLGFILFLIYTCLIFFIKEYYLLCIVLVINIILMIIVKENIKKAIISLLKITPFIIFTTVINIAFSGISYGILIGIRLMLVCNITYIYAKKMTPGKLQYVIEILLKPLKIFKINSKEIGIIVCIGIAFIPIIQREITEIKYSLKSKGFDLRFTNIIKKPNYILTPLLTQVIKRVGQIEQSLLSKGYVAE